VNVIGKDSSKDVDLKIRNFMRENFQHIDFFKEN